MVLVILLFLLAGGLYARVAINENTSNVINDIANTTKISDIVDLKVLPKETKDIKINCTKNNDNANELNGTVNVDTQDCITVETKDDIEVVPEKEDNGSVLLLTPFIEDDKLDEARNASRVDQSLFNEVESYSGFLTVDKRYNSNIFFWYFPVADKNVTGNPWIIWLQGGPGASSLTGLFHEIGPFYVDTHGQLQHNPHSWHLNHSLLFIDSPVGAGFSFTCDDAGFPRDMPTYANHLYATVKQFLKIFPELRTVPLYVAGESYAGKYVPALSMEIHKHKNNPGENVNFQGVIVGNPYIDSSMLTKAVLPYKYFGLMDKEQLDLVQPLQDSFNQAIAENNSTVAKYKWGTLTATLLYITDQSHAYNFLRDKIKNTYEGFIRSSTIRKAIHVGDMNFASVNISTNLKLSGEFLTSAKWIYEELLEEYRLLVYCGQLDLILPCVSVSEQLRSWSWNGTNLFKKAHRLPMMLHNHRVGYFKFGGGLTEVIFRGAGHMVPWDQPEVARHVVTEWTRSHQFVTSKSYLTMYNTTVQWLLKNEIPNLSDYGVLSYL